jgi:hypothetical protein
LPPPPLHLLAQGKVLDSWVWVQGLVQALAVICGLVGVTMAILGTVRRSER